MSVSRSHKHIGVQIIDDVRGQTLVSASTQEKDVAGKIQYGGNQDAAVEIGKIIAERASTIEIRQVCFDRGSYKYHGRVAALAEAAREAGLSF